MSDNSAPDFGNTRWSLVAALKPRDSDAGGDAARQRLFELCLHYWYPVYVYLRRCGHAPDVAQKMTAGFFAQLLRDGPRRAAGAHVGRFRLFLQEELHRYLSRNPSIDIDIPAELASPLPLDELEARQQTEPTDGESPEQSMQRGFALEVIGHARARLREEARQAGRLAMYEAMERYLGAEPEPGEYEALANRLGAKPVFVALAVKRLRQRFRELVELELSQTVSNAADLDSERVALLSAIAETER